MPPTTDTIAGLHHVTAIAVDPQANLDFYTRVLGLKLVKQTVNFDAPDVYHFYYGDRRGTPGSILTFFPFTDAGPGKVGPGTTASVIWRTPPGSLEGWMVRLTENGLDFDGPFERFGRPHIGFADPDGLNLEIAEHAGTAASPETALSAFDGVTLALETPGPSADLLIGLFGFRLVAEEAGRQRLESPEGGDAAAIELLPASGERVQGGGSVHHIAFRVADDAALTRWRERLVGLGMDVTPVRERLYFRSIYFREPGGILFELATMAPGFTVDEPVEALGSALQLPPWLEADRARIERRLPPVRMPQAAGRSA